MGCPRPPFTDTRPRAIDKWDKYVNMETSEVTQTQKLTEGV